MQSLQPPPVLNKKLAMAWGFVILCRLKQIGFQVKKRMYIGSYIGVAWPGMTVSVPQEHSPSLSKPQAWKCSVRYGTIAS